MRRFLFIFVLIFTSSRFSMIISKEFVLRLKLNRIVAVIIKTLFISRDFFFGGRGI